MDDISSDEVLLLEYLDGELSQKERRTVEERLAQEPELRNELVRLETSWQKLDLLEREGTDDTLVETTMEVVAVKTEESLQALKSAGSLRRYWKTAVMVPLGLLKFFGTFVIGGHFAMNAPALARAASPVIENLDMYLMVLDEQPDFLPLLSQQRIFLPPLPDDVPPVPLAEYQPQSPETGWALLNLFPNPENDRRIQRIEDFDESLYSKFYSNYRKFLELSEEKRDELRQLYGKIERSPRRIELYQTLYNYYNWRKSLQNYEKAELRQPYPADKQVERIAALKKRLDEHIPEQKITPVIAASLLSSDIEELSRQLESLPMSSKDVILDAPPNQMINILKRLSGEGTE